jgi:hypothetical protein
MLRLKTALNNIRVIQGALATTVVGSGVAAYQMRNQVKSLTKTTTTLQSENKTLQTTITQLQEEKVAIVEASDLFKTAKEKVDPSYLLIIEKLSPIANRVISSEFISSVAPVISQTIVEIEKMDVERKKQDVALAHAHAEQIRAQAEVANASKWPTVFYNISFGTSVAAAAYVAGVLLKK